MFSFLEELFLKEYFLHIAILGNNCAKLETFYYLAKSFKIPENRAKTLFELTEQQSVQEITSEADANRYKRIAQFQAISNKPNIYDEQTDAIITIKTESITTASQMDLCMDIKTTKSKIYQMLLDRANCGNVDAMRVLGTLQINGIFAEKNWSVGKDYLIKAAEWGDVVAMFLLIRAGVDDFKLKNNFYFATQNTPFSDLHKIANIDSFITTANQSGILLLNKLFAQKTVKQNIYSQPHAHVIYATGISNEEKEKLLFSENKQYLSDALNLPIYRPTDTGLHCRLSSISEMPISREKEQNQIIAALRNRDLRGFSTYRPLCLCTNSQYVQELYAKAVANCFRDEFVQRIDVSSLQEFDFEPTSNNVFVRSCKYGSNEVELQKLKNDTNNVFVLFLNGDIPGSILRHIKEFLSTEWRRQFRLIRPCVTLDFSYTLPICICDSYNAKKLKMLVETIQISDIDSGEASKLIGEMLDQKAKLYFDKNIELTDNAVESLAKLPLETAEEIIDTAYRSQRAQLGSSDKVAFAIKPYVESYNRQHGERTFGFGGYSK